MDILLLEEGGENEALGGERPEILARLVWKQPPLTLYRYGVNGWADGWCRANLDWRRYSLVASRYVTPITKIRCPAHARTLVDCDDAWYTYPPEADTLAAGAKAAALGWLRNVQITRAIGKFDHAFFCSERDRGMFPAPSSSVLPNVVRAVPQPTAQTRGATGTVLFVGSLWYPPNRHGIEWFLAQCWPAIAARCPGLSLRLVGPAPAADRARWARAPRTEAPGFVEDLEAEYSAALFTIAPVLTGGGTSIKFLESAAHGRACVVTSHVFDAFGADFPEGDAVMVARGARAMVEGCVGLYEDAGRRGAVAARAHAIVTRLYTVERFEQTVREAVRALLPEAAGAPEGQPRLPESARDMPR